MPEPHESSAEPSLARRIEELTRAYVAVPSHTGTALERGVEPFLRGWFESVPHFQDHPGHCGFHPIPGDPLGRSVAWALVRGADRPGERTIVLIHHSDTADVQDYGELRPLAYDPGALRARMAGPGQGPFDAGVRADLESGDWLFGRGVCDMKGGGAIELALLERYAASGACPGNLLLLALPDEENLSAGMRAAVPLLAALKARFALDYRLMINTEPHMRTDPGTGVLYEGSVGKIMPLVYVKGQAAHVGQVFGGFNPILLLAEIVRRTELNPEFMDRVGAESPLPPVWLNLKDRKHQYDVSLPLSAAGYLSIMSLTRSPREHLELLRRICEAAFAAVLAWMNRSHEAYARNVGREPGPLPWVPEVLTFEQVQAAALSQDGPSYRAASRDQLLELERLIAAGAIDLPEASVVLIELALAHSGIHRPVVVLALSPPCYPGVSNRQVAARAAGQAVPPAFLELAGLAEALRGHALAAWNQPYRILEFFDGLSDLSYAIQDGDDAAMAFTRASMPLWGPIYSIPFEAIRELSLPVLNIGPWGKDFHKNTERVYLPDLCERTPALVQEAIRIALAPGGTANRV